MWARYGATEMPAVGTIIRYTHSTVMMEALTPPVVLHNVMHWLTVLYEISTN